MSAFSSSSSSPTTIGIDFNHSFPNNYNNRGTQFMMSLPVQREPPNDRKNASNIPEEKFNETLRYWNIDEEDVQSSSDGVEMDENTHPVRESFELKTMKLPKNDENLKETQNILPLKTTTTDPDENRFHMNYETPKNQLSQSPAVSTPQFSSLQSPKFELALGMLRESVTARNSKIQDLREQLIHKFTFFLPSPSNHSNLPGTATPSESGTVFSSRPPPFQLSSSSRPVSTRTNSSRSLTSIKSNLKIIQNAIISLLLPGQVNKERREKLMSILNTFGMNVRFVLLLTGGLNLAAVYKVSPPSPSSEAKIETEKIYELRSTSPEQITVDTAILKTFRFDTATKKFKEIPRHTTIDNVVDAFIL
jgi:Microtubule-binding calmodulin-regulated spectrin-associated